MRISQWFAAAVIFCLQTSAFAQTTFEWKFEDSYLSVHHVAHQEITVLGRTKVTDSVIDIVFKVHPSKVNEEGAVIDYTVVSVDDSSVQKGEPEEKGTFAPLKGQTFHVQVKPRNESIKITGYDQIADPLFPEAKDAKPAEKAFMVDIVAYLLQFHVMDAYMPLPGGAVTTGQKWRHAIDMKLLSFAQVKLDREYSFAGKRTVEGKDFNAVEWTSKLAIAPLKDTSGALPFTVKEIKFTGDPTDTGTALWDPATGLPVRIQTLQKTNTDMLMVIEGHEMKGSGATEDTLTLKFSKTNPAEKDQPSK